MSKPRADKDIAIPDYVLKELLTPSEWRMLKNRWQILNLLKEGLPVRKIAGRVGVGTDTVIRVKAMSVKLHLKNPEVKPQTSWIFGKK